MSDTTKTSSPATTDKVTVTQNPSSTEGKEGKEVHSVEMSEKTSRKSSSDKKEIDSSTSNPTETISNSNAEVNFIPGKKVPVDATSPNPTQKSSDSLNAQSGTPTLEVSTKQGAKSDAKANAPLKQGASATAKANDNAKVNVKVNAKNAQKPSRTNSNAQKQNNAQSQSKASGVNANRKQLRPAPKMSNARFVDKVFQNSSEALSRALVRKEQKQLLDQVLDADVPISHKEDAHMPTMPTQVMKMPKVPPETRPGRAAMFGNVPLSPLQYEPRHKSEDFSKAYLREKVYLDTDQAQRLFENCYDDINVSFSILTTVLRRYDKDAFNKTEKSIIAELTRIQEHFRKGLTDVASSLDECVKEESRRVAFHDHEREYVVPIHTPYSLRYITCVTLYDKYVSRLNAALITGIVDYDSFDSCLRAANTILQQFRHDAIIIRHRTLRDLRNHSGKRTEIKRAEQMAEKSAQEERMKTSDPHPSKRKKS